MYSGDKVSNIYFAPKNSHSEQFSLWWFVFSWFNVNYLHILSYQLVLPLLQLFLNISATLLTQSLFSAYAQNYSILQIYVATQTCSIYTTQTSYQGT